MPHQGEYGLGVPIGDGCEGAYEGGLSFPLTDQAEAQDYVLIRAESSLAAERVAVGGALMRVDTPEVDAIADLGEPARVAMLDEQLAR